MGNISNSISTCLKPTCLSSCNKYLDISVRSKEQIFQDLKEKSEFDLKRIDEERLKVLQLWWKRLSFIKKNSTNTSNSLYFNTQYSTCVKRKDEREIIKPGVDIDVNSILIETKILNVEKSLNDFVIEESQLIKFIHENREHLTKSCLKYKDGCIYFGYFNRNWEREGYGILILPDGAKYQGFFRNDKMKGRGRLIQVNGSYYEGEFDENKPNGYGEEHLIDYSIYQGIFSNGTRNGKGKIIWSDGSIYDGDFLANEIEGFGFYKWNDGRLFQGQWKNGKMHGKGIFIAKNKNKYIGEYFENKKSGYGIVYWSGSKKFEGQWMEDKKHGYGIVLKKGIKHYGIWENGKKIQDLSEGDENIKNLSQQINIMIYNDFYSSEDFTYILSDYDSSTTYKESLCTDEKYI